MMKKRIATIVLVVLMVLAMLPVNAFAEEPGVEPSAPQETQPQEPPAGEPVVETPAPTPETPAPTPETPVPTPEMPAQTPEMPAPTEPMQQAASLGLEGAGDAQLLAAPILTVNVVTLDENGHETSRTTGTGSPVSGTGGSVSFLEKWLIVSYWELTATPSSSEYYFKEWSSNVTLNTIRSNGDKTVTAYFQKYSTLTLGTEGNGSLGNTSIAKTYVDGDRVNLSLALPWPNDISHYYFAGWKDNQNPNAALLKPAVYNPDFQIYLGAVNITMNGNRSFSAVFKGFEYDFSVVSAGHGTVDTSVNGKREYGTPYDLGNANPQPDTGYRFKEWLEKKGSWPNYYWEPTGAVVTIGVLNDYKAVFELETYSITYNNVDDTTGFPLSYTFESSTITLPTPTRTGCDFVKWVDPDGATVTEIPAGSTGDKVFTAVWQLNGTDITIEGYAGTYDGIAHGLTVTGTYDALEYSLSETGPFVSEIKYTNVDETPGTDGVKVYVKVARGAAGPYIGYGYIKINPKPLTVTADSKTMTYGQSRPALTVSYDGFVDPENAASSLTGTPALSTNYDTSGPNAGSYAITVDLSGVTANHGNYTLTKQDGTLTVNKKELTVAAKDRTIRYGDDIPSYGYTITGIVPGENVYRVVTGEPALSCAYAPGSPVGSYPITVTVTGMSAQNYTFVAQDGTVTVNRTVLTVTANDITIHYGDAVPTFTAEITGFVLGQRQEDVVPGAPAFRTTYTQGDAPGTSTIRVSAGTLTPNGNYRLVLVNGTLTVDKKPLTVTAENKTTTYGQAAPAFTATYSPFTMGQDESVLGGALVYICEYGVTSSGAGDYPITPSGLTSANYDITFVPGTLTVGKVVLTVTANNKSIIYGDAIPVYSVQYAGFIPGEDESKLVGTLAFDCDYAAGEAAKSYSITPKGLTADNYTITFVDGTLTVVKKALTVTADNKTVTYLDPAPAYSVTYGGFITGDTAADLGGTLIYACAYAPGSAMGTYTITPGGLTSGNYSLTYVPGTLTVSDLVLTVEFADYNGTILKTEQVGYGNAATAPAAPTREGHRFTGWDVAFSNVTGSLTVTAQYAVNTYTVRFFAADGVTQIGATQTVDWGTAARFETAPARTGSAFDEWVLTGDDDTVVTSLTNVRENITAVASYLLNGYTVTFVDFNGNVIGTDGVLYGGSAVAPTPPAREGYTFTGWDSAFDDVRGNMTVTAQYRINTYTVTFVNYDGTVISEVTVNWNTAAAAPADPTRDGYTFTGWDTDFSAVTGDITVTAQFTQNEQLTEEPVPGTGNTTTLEDEEVPQQGPAAFPWWWILIGVGLAGLLFLLIFFLAKRRKDEEQQNA